MGGGGATYRKAAIFKSVLESEHSGAPIIIYILCPHIVAAAYTDLRFLIIPLLMTRQCTNITITTLAIPVILPTITV